jgi:hypothetical protein
MVGDCDLYVVLCCLVNVYVVLAWVLFGVLAGVVGLGYCALV